MATPTIKKESFFEYNPVRKRNLSCEFAWGFELLCFPMAGLTNITIGQLNTELYDGDNGIPKFCICENLETHFHLVLFENWHDN